jgi:mannosyl-oligosaccharide alpha-1,2-mannosidase
MMEHSWNSYRKYAWGQNYLRPISKKIDDKFQMGATIVNSLTTLLIMNMSDEFKSARDWIETNLDICSLDTIISVSETVNRFVGSLLSAFAFTNDTMFLKKAKYVADCLLPAFNTKSGQNEI